jgi:RHS repeat-associated protein
VPDCVTVDSESCASPCFFMISNGHGDVVNLPDASGTVVASYAYDEFGVLTSRSETLPNGWTNPYRSDGRDGVRSDGETGLSWMRVRAYDPSVGRFISRDPLGRVPLFFADQPYAYAGNNPLVNVDPSGQRRETIDGGDWTTPPPPSPTHTPNWGRHARIVPVKPKHGAGYHPANSCNLGPLCGVKNWGRFVEGILEVVGSFASLGAAVWAEFQGSPIPGAIFLIQRGVQLAGSALIFVIHDGIQHIIEGLGGHVTPWVQFILDVIKVIGDVAVLATSGYFFTKAVLARGRATLNFFQKLALILRELGKGATNGVFKEAAEIMGPAVINIFAGAFFLIDDSINSWEDLQKALKS